MTSKTRGVFLSVLYLVPLVLALIAVLTPWLFR
jgi:hypothetical protein